MLKMRQAQMQTLGEVMLKRFVHQMEQHLRSEFEIQVAALDEASLRSFIQDGIVRAESYEVVDEADVQSYLECMAIYGPDFDRSPGTAWAGEILQNTKRSGKQKMVEIANYETFVLKGNSSAELPKSR